MISGGSTRLNSSRFVYILYYGYKFVEHFVDSYTNIDHITIKLSKGITSFLLCSSPLNAIETMFLYLTN